MFLLVLGWEQADTAATHPGGSTGPALLCSLLSSCSIQVLPHEFLNKLLACISLDVKAAKQVMPLREAADTIRGPEQADVFGLGMAAEGAVLTVLQCLQH